MVWIGAGLMLVAGIVDSHYKTGKAGMVTTLLGLFAGLLVGMGG